MSGKRGEITSRLLTIVQKFAGAVLQSGDIQAIDVSAVDYDPGKNFALLVGTGGTLKIVDTVSPDEKAIPVQTGYNPIVITKVISDGGNTASSLWALF